MEFKKIIVILKTKMYIDIVKLKNKNENLLLHHDFFVEIRFSQGIPT